MRILLFISLMICNYTSASELNSKSDLKAHYAEIGRKAQLLKTVPDDELVAEILTDCMKARKFDSNVFCLESITEFYKYFPNTVERVSSKHFSKEESDFILKRLNILRVEAAYGNDPSSEP
tara:strand:- start:633 stop:995 length:363 start_codon:yes stop_codon:yes gene_type:complete